MKQYILKLKTTSTVNYAVYDGTAALTDAQLTTLFTTAGSAYFTFDFDSLTPTNLTSLTIVDSSDTAVVTNTGLPANTIAEDKDYKGTWSASATAFDTFTVLSGVAMDEAQLNDLMGKIKSAKEIKELSITADIKAKDLFGDNNTIKDGDIYLVKNTANGAIRISFTNNVSDTDITHYVMLGGHTSILFIFEQSGSGNLVFTAISSRTGFGGSGYNSAQYNNIIIKSGLWDPFYGYVSNPQIAGLQLAAVDNLTTTATMNPLSAKQGKQLNDNIGTLSNLTTTAKTSAVAAINELHSNAALVGTTLSTPSNVAYVATANIQDGAVTPAKIAASTYSTAEQVVGTWIDGKPLYRKSFSGTTFTSGGISEYVDLDSSSQKNYIRGYGTIDFGGSVQRVGDVIWDANKAITTVSRMEVSSSSTFRLMVTKNSGPQSYRVSIEYTKTTD